jgi:hypothetical protein
MKPSGLLYLIISLIFLTSASCDKDPVIPNPEELITTMIYTVTPVSGEGSTVIYTFRDLDGDGGNPPVITISGNGGDTLKSGAVYEGVIELWNESVNPAVNITSEVDAESEDHQFFYDLIGLHATVEYADVDDNGFPVGLQTMVSPFGPGVGSLDITLRHLPDKAAAGVSDGNIQNAGGETDIAVSFPVLIVP